MAEYAVGSIVIGYAAGDNPKYVTQNLTLPTKVESSDISWASSSGAISSNGTVTRQDTDTDVTLTATATYNGKSAKRTFELKVIKKRTRDNSKIQTLPLETASSGDISITRNESGDVVDIEGNYSNFNIENADDAIDAITVIKDELGISNPIQELEPAVITSDNYGAEYQFQQVHEHNGEKVKVFGRGLMASANAKGKGDFMHSNLLPSEVIAKADGKNDIGKTAAENAAKAAYSGDIEVDLEHTEKMIYSLEDYENAPVYTYIIRIFGTAIDGTKIDESVLVNAENANTILSMPNISNVKMPGIDERGEDVDLDVMLRVDAETGNNYYVLYDNSLHLGIYNGIVGIDYNLVKTDKDIWDSDGQAVSAYINMIDVLQWWKNTFGRKSLDNKGMRVRVHVHDGNNDNAYFYCV